MAEFKVELSDEDIANLTALANKRGLRASTVLQQAISTEKLISDNVGPKDELLIRKGDDSFKKITFGT